MCGKFTQMASWRQVHDYADLLKARVNDDVQVYTPMRAVPVVHLGPDGDRIVTPMTWGYTDRSPDGQRGPRNMHARGESVHEVPRWEEAFHLRLGVTFVKSFNEGKDIPILYDDGTPTGKKWTQQWTLKRKDSMPAIIAVIFDAFDVGRGTEYEFAQVTVKTNSLISSITERMPLMLDDEEIPLWLGEWRAPIEEVMELIRPREFGDEWEMHVEDPSKKPPRPRRKK